MFILYHSFNFKTIAFPYWSLDNGLLLLPHAQEVDAKTDVVELARNCEQ